MLAPPTRLLGHTGAPFVGLGAGPGRDGVGVERAVRCLEDDAGCGDDVVLFTAADADTADCSHVRYTAAMSLTVCS